METTIPVTINVVVLKNRIPITDFHPIGFRNAVIVQIKATNKSTKDLKDVYNLNVLDCDCFRNTKSDITMNLGIFFNLRIVQWRFILQNFSL